MKTTALCRLLIFLLLSFFYPLHATVAPASAADDTVTVLILGDSLSAGLGVAPEMAYPSLVQEMLTQNGSRPVRIVNGSISGSTTAGAHSRLKWFLRAEPDILILALGANDGLRGLSTELMTQNLENAIDLAKEHRIRVILAGMKLPPNYGPDYARAFEQSFSGLARKHDLPFIPFLLKDVAGIPSLNQSDGIHPNAEGHKIMADTVFPFLKEQL